jgi:hypothetical protein
MANTMFMRRVRNPPPHCAYTGCKNKATAFKCFCRGHFRLLSPDNQARVKMFGPGANSPNPDWGVYLAAMKRTLRPLD